MNSAPFVRFAVFFLAASPSLLSLAGLPEDADAAYKTGDYATALHLWRDLAGQGDASAQNGLGVLYSQGRGVTKDDVEAARWYGKAAEQGLARGQNNLGTMYRDGRGVARDDAAAVSWFRKAAEQGFAAAEANLGFMYERGRGVAKDDFQAVQWYRKAAEQGNALGQTNLGYMYANGRGVDQDAAAAVQWYRTAAEQGEPLGQNNLGVMYRDGRGVAKDEALAAMWFRKAAERGNALAQKNLAAMSAQGPGDAKSAEAVTPPPLPASTSIDRRADFDVGRVSLRMPDAAWETVGTSRRGLAYTGDRSGEIPSLTRYLLLRDDGGKFRAALVVSASWGVGAVRMTWTQNCRPQQNVHVVDNARRDFNGRDCLRVTGSISPQRYLELAAPDMLPELATRKVPLPRAGYAVSDEIGLENGTYVAVQAVFAADFNLPNDESANDALPAGVKPEAVAWGGRLAEAVRSCAHSLSGALAFPPITARAK